MGILSAFRSKYLNQSGEIPLNNVAALSRIFGVGMPAYSGKPVNDRTSMKVATAYACTRLISGAISQMPIRFYTKDEKGVRRKTREALERLVNLEPCPLFSGCDLLEWIVVKILLRGNAYVLIRRDGATPTQLIPVDPANVQVRQMNGRNIYIIWRETASENSEDFGKGWMAFDQDDILHFHNFNFDGMTAPSVIASGGFQAIGNAMAMDEYSGSFFKDGALQSYAIIKDGSWTEAQIKEIREQWMERYAKGLDSKKLPMVFDKSVDIKNLSINARDAQLIESKSTTAVEIALAFGLPSFMVNQEQKTTSWGQGVSEIGQIFLNHTLMPRIRHIEGEFDRKLFRRQSAYTALETIALVRGTMKQRYENYKLALGGGSQVGWLSVNDVREREDYPPVEGEEYEKPFLPSNTPDEDANITSEGLQSANADGIVTGNETPETTAQ